jgi:hypothetical protein
MPHRMTEILQIKQNRKIPKYIQKAVCKKIEINFPTDLFISLAERNKVQPHVHWHI